MKYQPHVVINLAIAGTEYSWQIPANAKKVTIQNREGDTNVLYYFVSNANGGGPGQDGNYFTLQAGSAKTFDAVFAGQTLYLQGVTNNNRNVEIELAI
jgi:hypothetical protein